MRSVRVIDIQRWVEELAPLCLAEEWDNVGLQIGKEAELVRGVLVCLEVNHAVIDQALQNDVQLIVAHHPLIFAPLRSLRADDAHESLIMRMIIERLSLYVAHTNLDAAPGGLGDWVAEVCGLHSVQPLIPRDERIPQAGFGRVGDLEAPVDFEEFAARLCRQFEVSRLRIAGRPPRSVERVAVLNGSGGSYMAEARAAEADVYVTGDVKHHDAAYAEALGLCVLDCGHFATERIVVPRLAGYLRERARAEGQDCRFHVADEKNPIAYLP
ncbi:MAG: Nif3-like dinuclear metal center hexameric protein [Firmicutes bacterium]|nr:Nif3-like dinuclear metal center hexameric protein [Bacillota bacterium]